MAIKMKFEGKTPMMKKGYYGGKCMLNLKPGQTFEINDESEAKRLAADFPDDFKILSK